MHLHYLLVVVVSDVKVMSSTVAVIFAIARVVKNTYNIQTKPRFLKRTEPNSFRNESEVFQKPNLNRTEILKNLFRTSLPTRQGHDPNRPTYGSKTGVMTSGVLSSGVWSVTFGYRAVVAEFREKN